MTKITFQRITGSIAPSGSPANPLINIRQLVEPPAGEHRAWLTARGWPFTGDPNAAYRTASLSRTYFDLLDAGLFDALDLLILSNGWSVEGSLLNCVSGKPDMASSPAPVTMIDGSITTDGTASYLRWELAANASRYQLADAEAFINLTATPPGTAATTPILGAISGSSVRFARNSGSPFALAQLNCSATINGTSPMNGSEWRAGLWGLTRTGTAIGILRDGQQISDRIADGTMAITPTIFVGRAGTDASPSYGAQRFTSFGLGRALSGDERAALTRILIAHGQDMVSFAR